MTMHALWLLPGIFSSAHASPGALVTGDGRAIAGSSAVVVYTHEEGSATLTLAPRLSADPGGPFGMIVPIPALVTADDVGTVDIGIIEHLLGYGDPISEVLTCEDLFGNGFDSARDSGLFEPGEWGLYGRNRGPGWCGCNRSWSCQANSPQPGVEDPSSRFEERRSLTDSGDTGLVSITDTLIAGAWDVAIVGAPSGGDLARWLEREGWQVDPAVEDALDAYARLGWTFVVARADPEDVPDEGGLFQPLSVHYDAEAMVVPMRLGGSGEGLQEAQIYAVTALDDGEIGIINYDRRWVSDECMVPPGVDMHTWYPGYARASLAGLLDDDTSPEDTDQPWWYDDDSGDDPPEDTDPADSDSGASDTDPADTDPADTDPPDTDVPEAPGPDIAAWDVEYGAGGGACDPCGAGGPLSADEIAALGWAGDADFAHVTRIRFVFTPDAVDQDVILYANGILASPPKSFVAYEHDLERNFPICGEGYADDPGSCFDGPYYYYYYDVDASMDPTGGIVAGVVGLGVFVWRRRRALRS